MNKSSKKGYIHGIKYDLKCGIIHQKKKFVIVGLISFVLLLHFFNLHHIALKYDNLEKSLTVGDCLLWLMKGNKPFIMEQNNLYLPDFSFILLHLLLGMYVSYYPFKDMHRCGYMVIFSFGNRSKWWISKCIWVTGTVIVYYLSLYISSAIFALFFGDLSLKPNPNIQSVLCMINISGITMPQFFISCIVIPILISIGLSLMQLCISLLSNPIFGVIFIIAMLGGAIFTMSPLMPGNYLMLMRNHLFLETSGITNNRGFSIAVILIICAFLMGLFIIEKKDLLSTIENK